MGYLDDLIIVPFGILLVVRLIPSEIMAEHRELAEAAQERPVSLTAGIVTVCIWVGSIALLGWLAYRRFAFGVKARTPRMPSLRPDFRLKRDERWPPD